MSRFAALTIDDDDEEDESRHSSSHMATTAAVGEDLSLMRRDEELALQTVYQEDFSKKSGTWGGIEYNIKLKPPDLAPEDVGSSLTLNALLGRQYPYVVPRIKFDNVKGLREKEVVMLMDQIQARAKECAIQGQEMMFELALVIEEFLLKCNRTPKEQQMSAWEQMKIRESLKVANSKSKDETVEVLSQFSKSYSTDEEDERHYESIDNSNIIEEHRNRVLNSADVERELQRQIQQIDAVAATRRRKNTMENNSNNRPPAKADEAEEYDDENDIDDGNIGFAMSLHSRYLADFVELGILGRGGGGEVVKCRNRLDRRIYAVKKILLEPERGRYAKHAAIQNRKLRREVTTISRMTHKNIVRYYQAWVEGNDRKFSNDESNLDVCDAASLSEENVSGEDIQSDLISRNSVSSKSGWWNISGKESMDVSNEGSSFTESSDSTLGDNALLDKVTFFPNNGLWPNQLTDDLNVDDSNKGRDREKLDVADFSSSVFGSDLNENGNQKCLYIQMEYCSTTLRHLIDIGELTLNENEVWRLTRQIIEALVYVHSRKLIHRDLKPSNIFIDNESNVRVGDFGLATSTRKEQSDTQLHDDDHLVGERHDSFHSLSRNVDHRLSQPSESLTTGVGTTFYRAPEQGIGSLYDEKVDIFSLGVVVFELFHRPFTTYMERAEILTRLRGEGLVSEEEHVMLDDRFKGGQEWGKIVSERFPSTFSAPEDAKRLILWCLRRDPKERPSAHDLLSCRLLPGKMELEKHYLEEALRTLSNPQSETYNQILSALFGQLQPYHIEVTYDSDIGIRASHQMRSINVQKSLTLLFNKLGGARWGDIESGIEHLNATNALSIIAIHSSLQRAQGIEKLGKGLDFGIPQRALSTIAMNASTASLVGAVDGVIGFDPRIFESIKLSLAEIFRLHSAIELSSPLLLPSQGKSKTNDIVTVHNPVELMNRRGHILLLPEDLTAGFARAIARGGVCSTHLKRYEIGKVYHDSLLGGHPRESYEAAFDIIFQDSFVKGDFLEAEVIQVLCQTVSSLANSQDFDLNLSEVVDEITYRQGSCWFLRITHTRVTEALFDICGVARDIMLRRACLRLISSLLSPTMDHRSTSRNNQDKLLDNTITEFISSHKIDSSVGSKMLSFLRNFDGPLPINILDSLDKVQNAFNKMRHYEVETEKGSKIGKTYDSASKGIRSIRRLLETLGDIGIFRLSANGSNTSNFSGKPAFVLFDFFEQKQQHIHGNMYFQGIFLPPRDTVSPQTKSQKKLHEEGIKFAEGGRFDDLIRKYRPPGNFGPSIVDSYTAAPIPLAVGVRFQIGRIIDRIYQVAALMKKEVDFHAAGNDMDVTRCVLGHPIPLLHAVKCIVSGTNGLDATSARARAEVASVLWSGGITSEYLPQSGAILSLLRTYANDESSSDWSLEQIYQVCFLLRIPFLVIVAPHFLRDKRSVRVKQIYHDSLDFKALGGHEEVVKICELANFIRDSLEARQKRLGKSSI